MAEIKHQQAITLGATQFQRIIRGFLARRKVKKILQNALEERMKDNRQWGAIVIQRIARGYIARHAIVRYNLNVFIIVITDLFLIRNLKLF